LNVARGGVIDEDALLEALRSNRIGGAALDVFSAEPLPTDSPLRTLPNVVLTPHLGASTAEAQHGVAIEIAEAVRAALIEGDLSRAVNAPAVGGDEMRQLRPILELARRIAALATALAGGPLTRIEVRYAGSQPTGMKLITAAAVAGALTHISGGTVNIVNAMKLAQSRGIRVEQSTEEPHAPYHDMVELRIASDKGDSQVAGALLGESHVRIVRLYDFPVSVTPRGTLLVLRNRDVPGIVGVVGTQLGKAGIRIDEYQQARRDGTGDAVALVRIDTPASDALLADLRALPEIQMVSQVQLE
jgi:D-3-phosphoglycerate dehydrogenase